MTGIWRDIRYAVRSLSQAPGFTSVVILVLGVGIGANVAMFGILHSTLIRPLPYEKSDQLVLGRATFDGRMGSWASAWDYWDFRDQSSSFQELAAFRGFPENNTITGGERPERISSLVVSINLFPALGVDPQLGRGFNPDEAVRGAPNVVMISHGFWQRRFGAAPDVIGGTLNVDEIPHTIVGVMPAGFQFYYDVDAWRPMRPDDQWVADRENNNWLIAGRLKDDVPIEEAQGEVDVIAAQLAAKYPEANSGKGLGLMSLQDALVEHHRQGLLLLMGAVMLVLLIACGNVAGLFLARGSIRRTEMSVRNALGASSSHVLRQLLVESLVVSVVAGAVGTVLALWLYDVLVKLMPAGLSGLAEASLSITMLAFALGVSLLVGLLSGVVPAMRAARGDLSEGLKSGGRATDAVGARFRSGLVAAQVAITVALLIGAGLLIRSFNSLIRVDPGFETENLLTAEIGLTWPKYRDQDRRIQFFGSLVDKVGAIPGVESVAIIDRLPILNVGGNEYVYNAEFPPLDPADRRSSNLRAVYPGYFEAMGIRTLSGRTISETDALGATPVFVISQNMAREYFPGEDPIGKRLVVDFDPPVTLEVVGVVDDVRQGALTEEPFRAMYASYLQLPYYTMRVALRTAVEPNSLARAFREAVWSLDADIPLDDLVTMEEVIGRSVSGWKVRALALTLFAALALILAAVGLYAVLAYYVAGRRHEIGIRMALGASSGDVVELVLKRGLALVAIGLVLGAAGSLALTRLLRDMLFQVEPTDLTTYVAVAFVFLIVGTVACLLPAWRALRVDPMSALQSE